MSISPTGGGFGLQLPSAWDQLQAQDQSLGDIAQQALDESSALSSALSDALANQISGAVNLAADAASTRLGISPNGSSSAPQTASTTLSTPNFKQCGPAAGL